LSVVYSEVGYAKFMVFNATLNNISAISYRSVLLVEVIEVPRENHRLQVTDKLYHMMLYQVHLIISIM